MDLAQILLELWRRRVLMAVGVVVAFVAALAVAYQVSLFPPGLSEKSLDIGTAETQLLVDAPTSVVGDLRIGGIRFLAERASIYAHLMTSRPVREAIARELSLDPDELVLTGPSTGQTKAQREPDARERSNQLVGEGALYQLQFDNPAGSPTITILAQSSDEEAAVRLANGAAKGFRRFVSQLERTQNVPGRARVTVRQLGSASGGTVAAGVNLKLASLAFLGVLLVWTLLVLLVGSVGDSMRRLRAQEAETQPAGDPGP